jgi:hypothetical protein
LAALGIACLLVWGGLWGYLVALQKRLDDIAGGLQKRSEQAD